MKNNIRLTEYAFYLLSRKRYTLREMDKKLCDYMKKYSKKFSEDKEWKSRLEEGDSLENLQDKLREDVIGRLLELKYLDDRSYAEDFIQSRSRNRPRGAFLLRKELRSKGVSAEVIDEALENTDIDEFEMAIQLLGKKCRQWDKYEKNKQREKAYRFLASKGLKQDAIYKAVDSCYNSTT